jgi:glycerol kinase
MSRSDWLCRRLAAALGVPVSRAGAEASARGTAALAEPSIAAQWPAGPVQAFLPQFIAGLAERQQRFLQELRL